jgi:uncharacterized protein YaiL (DUF2058 family)
MSFTDLKISDLRKVADSFGVDVKEAKTKQEIVALFEEEGVTYQMYNQLSSNEKVEIEVPKKKEAKMPKAQNSVLVKMERDNHSYQTIGYTFTDTHPFVAMSESDAQRIFDTQEGFRLATPREAQEFYA